MRAPCGDRHFTLWPRLLLWLEAVSQIKGIIKCPGQINKNESSKGHDSDTCSVAPSLAQIIQPELLQQGFDLVQSENLEVTDDVSIIEALGKPVKVTRGSYTNIKVEL